MRKLIPFILIFCMLTGCVKQLDYDALIQENAELTAQVAELTQQKDELTQLQKANEPEKTVTARVTGGITSVVCYRKYATTQQENISRFYEIIEGAVPIDNPPEFKQGAISYYFDVFTSEDSEYCRSYVINNDILMEEQTNGTYKYYQLDEKNKDYMFLAESCKD